MSSTLRNRSDERSGIRVTVSAHRTRHRLKRRRATLFPRLEARDVKVVSARRLGRRFPRQVVVAH